MVSGESGAPGAKPGIVDDRIRILSELPCLVEAKGQ
jgi:hypothetical protein